MRDIQIKNNGASHKLKSVSDFLTQYPTYEAFAAALVAGNLPVDISINAAGVDQMGTGLRKGTLLSDETAAKFGIPAASYPTVAPNDILSTLGTWVPPLTKHTWEKSSDLGHELVVREDAADNSVIIMNSSGALETTIYYTGALKTGSSQDQYYAAGLVPDDTVTRIPLRHDTEQTVLEAIRGKYALLLVMDDFEFQLGQQWFKIDDNADFVSSSKPEWSGSVTSITHVHPVYAMDVFKNNSREGVLNETSGISRDLDGYCLSSWEWPYQSGNRYYSFEYFDGPLSYDWLNNCYNCEAPKHAVIKLESGGSVSAFAAELSEVLSGKYVRPLHSQSHAGTAGQRWSYLDEWYRSPFCKFMSASASSDSWSIRVKEVIPIAVEEPTGIISSSVIDSSLPFDGISNGRYYRYLGRPLSYGESEEELGYLKRGLRYMSGSYYYIGEPVRVKVGFVPIVFVLCTGNGRYFYMDGLPGLCASGIDASFSLTIETPSGSSDLEEFYAIIGDTIRTVIDDGVHYWLAIG